MTLNLFQKKVSSRETCTASFKLRACLIDCNRHCNVINIPIA